MNILNNKQIKIALKKLENWQFINNTIHANYSFKNFKECFEIMSNIALECEKLNHHPIWTNSFNKLNISLTTHDVGGITNLDIKLATKINSIINH